MLVDARVLSWIPERRTFVAELSDLGAPQGKLPRTVQVQGKHRRVDFVFMNERRCGTIDDEVVDFRYRAYDDLGYVLPWQLVVLND
jgi:hypothetical protein